MKKGEMIVAIVNKGNADLVMEGAKKAGATGGTVFNAHGTANKEIRSFFGIPVLPEKEMIFIIVDNKIKDAIEDILKGYERYYKEDKKILTKEGSKKEKNSFITKMMANMGIDKEVKK